MTIPRRPRSTASALSSPKPNAPDPQWIGTGEAARLLSVSIHTLYGQDDIRSAVRRKQVGTDARTGVLWFRPDIEAILAVRKRFELRTKPAARLVRHGLRA